MKVDFTRDDFGKQIKRMTKLGVRMQKIMSMVPCMGGIKEMKEIIDRVEFEADMKRLFGVIDSMTSAEKQNPKQIDESRRRRIAAGAGVKPNDVKELVKQFDDTAGIVKNITPNLDVQKRLCERAKELFPAVYLTLVSIIQSVICGYLIFVVDNSWSELTFARVIEIVVVSLIIIITWHEYMMGAITLTWIPRLRDAVLPFALGGSEALAARAVFLSLPMWCVAVALYCLIGYLAYRNMYGSARQHVDNTAALAILGKWSKITERWTICLGAFFLCLGLFAYKYPWNVTSEYIIPVLIALAFASFMLRGIVCWKRLVGSRQGMQAAVARVCLDVMPINFPGLLGNGFGAFYRHPYAPPSLSFRRRRNQVVKELPTPL